MLLFAAAMAVVVGLLACNGKADKGKTDRISGHWLGDYNLNINYGPLDEFASMFIIYNVGIYPDSCVLNGMGYQTGFKDLCKAQEESANILHLMYKKTIEEYTFTDHSRIDTLATLIKDGQQYYIKSPIICDTNWETNKKMPLQKSGSGQKDVWLIAKSTNMGNEITVNKGETSDVANTLDNRLVNKSGTLWYFSGSPRFDDNSIVFYETGKWVDPLYVEQPIQGRKGTWSTAGNKLTWIFKGGARGEDGSTFTKMYEIKKGVDGNTVLILYDENESTEYVLCTPNVHGSCINYDNNEDAKIEIDFKELEKNYK